MLARAGLSGPITRRAAGIQRIVVVFKRTGFATRFRFTEILAQPNDQGVVFVKELSISRKGAYKNILEGVIIGIMSGKIVAVKEAFGVGVDHKNGLVEGIEQDRIRGLGADAVDRQKFGAQNSKGLFGHSGQRAPVFLKQKPYKILKPPGLDVKITRGTDERRKLQERDSFQRPGRKHTFPAQIGNGLLDIVPVGILREDRADNDLKRRAPRPPVLGAEAAE